MSAVQQTASPMDTCDSGLDRTSRRLQYILDIVLFDHALVLSCVIPLSSSSALVTHVLLMLCWVVAAVAVAVGVVAVVVVGGGGGGGGGGVGVGVGFRCCCFCFC